MVACVFGSISYVSLSPGGMTPFGIRLARSRQVPAWSSLWRKTNRATPATGRDSPCRVRRDRQPHSLNSAIFFAMIFPFSPLVGGGGAPLSAVFSGIAVRVETHGKELRGLGVALERHLDAHLPGVHPQRGRIRLRGLTELLRHRLHVRRLRRKPEAQQHRHTADRKPFHFSLQWNVSENPGPYCVTANCTSLIGALPLVGTLPVSMWSAL